MHTLPYYEMLIAENNLRSKNWSKYIYHQIKEPLFEHPNLPWDVIWKYYKKAFREFYLRPGYILRRFLRDIRKGDLLYDIRYFFGSQW